MDGLISLGSVAMVRRCCVGDDDEASSVTYIWLQYLLSCQLGSRPDHQT